MAEAFGNSTATNEVGNGLDVPNESARDEARPVPAFNPALDSAQDVTSHVLDFLSHASNETLGACFVGLGATTYLVLGRVGLVIIGIVGGIILHATWEGNTSSGLGEEPRAKEIQRRRELGLGLIGRVLDWREHTRNKFGHGENIRQREADVLLSSGSTLDYSGFAPETALALDGLTDAVIQDYVKWWYSPILPAEASFPAACRQAFTGFVMSISAHLSRKRHADAFLDFLTNSSAIVIVFLGELATALATSTTPSSAADVVESYLEKTPNSNLANIIDRTNQEKKLRMVSEDILESFLDSKTFNCEPARLFLKEILAGVVLEKTVQSCSKPEWINELLVYLLEDGEPELMSAIDVGMGRDANDIAYMNSNFNPSLPRSSTKTSEEERSQSMGHRKRVSKAEEAMQETIQEIQRINNLIAAGEIKGKVDDLVLDNGAEMDSPVPPVKQTLPSSDPHAITSAVAASPFTSFDQILPLQKPTALQSGLPLPPKLQPSEPSPMTLHTAKITIFDDTTPGDKGRIRTKPMVDYLIQIEPAKSTHPGWMIVRKYADFETLHEVLRRISGVSIAKAFTAQHATLPSWKGNTKSGLTGELERYLGDALWYKDLAESEGMKRFLEKEQDTSMSSSSGNGKGNSGIGWPGPASFETMGKGMLDALTSAPKGAADGGKAMLGGITGAIGAVGSLGQKKPLAAPPGTTKRSITQSRASMSIGSLDRTPSVDSMSPTGYSPESFEALESRKSVDSMNGTTTLPPRPSPATPQRGSIISESENTPPKPASSRSYINNKYGGDHTRDALLMDAPQSMPHGETYEDINLPPPPSAMPDDFDSATTSPPRTLNHSRTESATVRSSTSTAPSSIYPSHAEKSTSLELEATASVQTSSDSRKTPLTEQETKVAVELLFAVINELYTLSSAWNIRRTLLTAAKTFLLRPGNPNLESIRVLIQDSVIEANVSDAGIASHINKLRSSSLPTEEELKSFPPPRTPEEKGKLRLKARKLLVERGMPQALTSVMGSAASGEALGRVFDCLQVEDVARGLVFGLLLQAVRAVTQ